MNQSKLTETIRVASQIILGKEQQIKLALSCLLANGHLLIEDVPGVGKTTLAHLLAKLTGLDYQRIQFTSDMLPSDIIGVSVYERESESFKFHQGAIFSQLVLADEINRATAKAQSALLEAMEERQITTDGHHYDLPHPFFVIATQNPNSQIGTFDLPESQLDRFLMRISMGYPDKASERLILSGGDPRQALVKVKPTLEQADLSALQQQVLDIHTSDALLDYLQAFILYSRNSSSFENGLSPRAGIAILKAAKAWALLEGRKHVLPEDLQAIIPSTVNHRLQSQDEIEPSTQLLDAVDIP